VPKKIFIVDDADFMVDMLRLLMSDAGYEVVGSASDGLRALESLAQLEKTEKASLPDVVTLDVNMPKIDGLELIHKIRALIPDVKIVLITSHATLPVVLKARESGTDAFIAKPFNPQTVLDTIGGLFDSPDRE
jgi:two-component system chemotaxis response regulator CheY